MDELTVAADTYEAREGADADDAGATAVTLPARKPGVTRYYQHPGPAKAFTELERAIGGRDKLVASLLHAPATDSLSYVVGLIADPRNDATDLSELCRRGRIHVGELVEAYKKGAMARAQVAAIHHVAENLPAVVEDAMVRARPHYVPCSRCRGTGTFTPEPTKEAPNPSPGPCENCEAVGQILVRPDLDRQKFAAELGGLGPKKAPIVDMSDRRQLKLGDGTPSGMTALLGAVDSLLYRGAASPRPSAPHGVAVDGEVIPGDSTGAPPNDGDAGRS